MGIPVVRCLPWGTPPVPMRAQAAGRRRGCSHCLQGEEKAGRGSSSSPPPHGPPRCPLCARNLGNMLPFSGPSLPITNLIP